MKSRFIISCILVITFLFLANPSNAQIRLPQLISDGMVLQQNTKLKIWGWASPGEKVIVRFRQRKYTTITSHNGEWQLEIVKMKSGGPYTMDISGSNHIVIQNILIGDVWFCAGQSNMVLSMDRVKEKYPEEISGADYSEIRNFFVPTASDILNLHTDLPPGKWLSCTPENVLSFGAATYFFSKRLYLKYHVPIGIINSSVGGTPIQAWLSADAISTIPEYAERLAIIRNTAFLNKTKHQDVLIGNQAKNNSENTDKGLAGFVKWYDTIYNPTGWNHFWLPGYWADQGISGLNGSVWFRKEINIPAEMATKSAQIYMGRIVDADNLYINGVLCGNTTYQYPPRRYNIADKVLKPGKNIITVQVINYTGKGGFVPDKPYYLTIGKDTIDLRGDWLYKVGSVFSEKDVSGNVFSAQNEPTGLYNTMVEPVVKYSIKGFVWYQGESNTDKPKEYRLLLNSLIADWRGKWQQGDLPFIYAQLPNFMEVKYSPAESNWAELREAQFETLSVPNTAMAVTIDAGEWNDIHPLDKKDVGERLALGAEKIAYHDTTVISSGPIYRSSKIAGTRIILTFTCIGGGLISKADTTLMQFEIAGADRKFVAANAKILNNQIVVWNKKVSSPVYVRYAWQDNPQGANLYNKEGLPASPFSTEY